MLINLNAKKNSVIRRAVASTTAFAFVLSLVCWFPQESFAKAEIAGSIRELNQINLQDLQLLFDTSQAANATSLSFSIPPDLGNVESAYRLGNVLRQSDSQLVIHIQDAHANPDAQAHIERLLAFLAKQSPKPLFLALEGSVGKLKPELLNLFPDYPKINDIIVSDLVSKGELTGAEKFAFEAKNVEVFGAEDPNLYRKNLAEFHHGLQAHHRNISRLELLNKEIRVLKKERLNTDLFILTEQRDAFSRQEIELIRYINTIKRLLAKLLQKDLSDQQYQFQYPNLVRLFKLMEGEKALDVTKALNEARQLSETVRMKVLDKKIKSGLIRYLKQLEPLLNYGNEKKNEKNFAALQLDIENFYPNVRTFFELLWAASRVYGFSLVPYLSLVRCGRFLVFQSEIDSLGLFREINQVEKRLEKQLIENEEERRILAIDKSFDLFERLYRLELSRKEYFSFRKSKKAIWRTLSQLHHQVPYPRPAETFYEGALRRDHALAENALRAPSGHQVVLIAGGFHSEGVRSYLQHRKIPFASIAPKIEKTDGTRDLYLRVIQGQNAGPVPLTQTSKIVDTLLETPPDVYGRLNPSGKQGPLIRGIIRSQLSNLKSVYGLSEKTAADAIEKALARWNEESNAPGQTVYAESLQRSELRASETVPSKTKPGFIKRFWRWWYAVPAWKAAVVILAADQITKRISFLFPTPSEAPFPWLFYWLRHSVNDVRKPGLVFFTMFGIMAAHFLASKLVKKLPTAQAKWSVLSMTGLLSNALEATLIGGTVDFIHHPIFGLGGGSNLADYFTLLGLLGLPIHAAIIVVIKLVRSFNAIYGKRFVSFIRNNLDILIEYKNELVSDLKKLGSLETYRRAVKSLAWSTMVFLAFLGTINCPYVTHQLAVIKWLDSGKSDIEKARSVVKEFASTNRLAAAKHLLEDLRDNRSLYDIHTLLLQIWKEELKRPGLKKKTFMDMRSYTVPLTNSVKIGQLFQTLFNRKLAPTFVPSYDIYHFLDEATARGDSRNSELFCIAAFQELLWWRHEGNNPKFARRLEAFAQRITKESPGNPAQYLIGLFDEFERGPIKFEVEEGILRELQKLLLKILEQQDKEIAQPPSAEVSVSPRSELRSVFPGIKRAVPYFLMIVLPLSIVAVGVSLDFPRPAVVSAFFIAAFSYLHHSIYGRRIRIGPGEYLLEIFRREDLAPSERPASDHVLIRSSSGLLDNTPRPIDQTLVKISELERPADGEHIEKPNTQIYYPWGLKGQIAQLEKVKAAKESLEAFKNQTGVDLDQIDFHPASLKTYRKHWIHLLLAPVFLAVIYVWAASGLHDFVDLRFFVGRQITNDVAEYQRRAAEQGSTRGLPPPTSSDRMSRLGDIVARIQQVFNEGTASEIDTCTLIRLLDIPDAESLMEAMSIIQANQTKEAIPVMVDLLERLVGGGWVMPSITQQGQRIWPPDVEKEIVRTLVKLNARETVGDLIDIFGRLNLDSASDRALAIKIVEAVITLGSSEDERTVAFVRRILRADNAIREAVTDNEDLARRVREHTKTKARPRSELRANENLMEDLPDDWARLITQVAFDFGLDAIKLQDKIELPQERVNVVLFAVPGKEELAILKASAAQSDVQMIIAFPIHFSDIGHHDFSQVSEGLIYQNGMFVLGKFFRPAPIDVSIIPTRDLKELNPGQKRDLPDNLFRHLTEAQIKFINDKGTQKGMVEGLVRVPKSYDTPGTKAELEALVQKVGEVVIKPVSGSVGRDVMFVNSDPANISAGWDQINKIRSQDGGDQILVEERISLYPLMIDQKAREWSVRVIVTRNPGKPPEAAPEIGFSYVRIQKNGHIRAGEHWRWTLEETFSHLGLNERAETLRADMLGKAAAIFQAYERRLGTPLKTMSVDFFVTPGLEIALNELSDNYGGWYDVLKDEARFKGALLDPHILKRLYFEGIKNRGRSELGMNESDRTSLREKIERLAGNKIRLSESQLDLLLKTKRLKAPQVAQILQVKLAGKTAADIAHIIRKAKNEVSPRPAGAFKKHPFRFRMFVGIKREALPDEDLERITSSNFLSGFADEALSIGVINRSLKVDQSFVLKLKAMLKRTGLNLGLLYRSLAKGGLGVALSAKGQRVLVEEDVRVSEQLKNFSDAAKNVDSLMAPRILIDYLTGGDGSYQPLIEHVNHILNNAGGNPRWTRPASDQSIANVGSIKQLDFWFVKIGMITNVLQVKVYFKNGSSVQFVVNIPRDLTDAAALLGKAYELLAADYKLNPHHVMEPFALAEGKIKTRRGEEEIPLLIGEWVEGFYEPHVYAGSAPYVHIWDSQQSPDAPHLSEEESDKVWQAITQAQSIYARTGSDGMVRKPFINAGDYIVRKIGNETNGSWDAIMIWSAVEKSLLSDDPAAPVVGLLLQGALRDPHLDLTHDFLAWGKPLQAIHAIIDGHKEHSRYLAAQKGRDGEIAVQEAEHEVMQLLHHAHDVSLPAIIENPALFSGWDRIRPSQHEAVVAFIKKTHWALGKFLHSKETSSYSQAKVLLSRAELRSARPGLRQPLSPRMAAMSKPRGKAGGRAPLRIHVPQITIQGISVISRELLTNSKDRLLSVNRGNGTFDSFLEPFHSDSVLTYDVIGFKRENKSICVLAITELAPGNGQPVKTWAVLNSDGTFIALEEKKDATLPSQFLERQAAYEQLAGFTYSWRELPDLKIRPGKEIVFEIPNPPLIEYPFVPRSVGQPTNESTARSELRSEESNSIGMSPDEILKILEGSDEAKLHRVAEDIKNAFWQSEAYGDDLALTKWEQLILHQRKVKIADLLRLEGAGLSERDGSSFIQALWRIDLEQILGQGKNSADSFSSFLETIPAVLIDDFSLFLALSLLNWSGNIFDEKEEKWPADFLPREKVIALYLTYLEFKLNHETVAADFQSLLREKHNVVRKLTQGHRVLLGSEDTRRAKRRFDEVDNMGGKGDAEFKARMVDFGLLLRDGQWTEAVEMFGKDVGVVAGNLSQQDGFLVRLEIIGKLRGAGLGNPVYSTVLFDELQSLIGLSDHPFDLTREVLISLLQQGPLERTLIAKALLQRALRYTGLKDGMKIAQKFDLMTGSAEALRKPSIWPEALSWLQKTLVSAEDDYSALVDVLIQLEDESGAGRSELRSESGVDLESLKGRMVRPDGTIDLALFRRVIEGKGKPGFPPNLGKRPLEFLLAFYLEGRDLGDIMEKMGILRVNTRSIHFRGIKALAEWLKPHHNFSQEELKKALSSLLFQRFEDWLKHEDHLPLPIELPLRNSSPGSHHLNRAVEMLLERLHIHLPAGFAGRLVAEFDPHYGYILNAKNRNPELLHRYLIADLSGKRFEPPTTPEHRKLFEYSLRGHRSSLYWLLLGYGPVDLNLALQERRVMQYDDPESGFRTRAVSLFGKLWAIKHQGQISLPSSYTFPTVALDIFGADFAENRRRVFLYEPESKEPVETVWFEEIDGKIRWQSDWLGRYADWRALGTRKKVARGSVRYLKGKRLVPPRLGDFRVYGRQERYARGGVHFGGHRFELPGDFQGSTVSARFLILPDGDKVLGFWATDAEPSKTTPLLALRFIDGKLKSITPPKEFTLVNYDSPPRAELRSARSGLRQPLSPRMAARAELRHVLEDREQKSGVRNQEQKVKRIGKPLTASVLPAASSGEFVLRSIGREPPGQSRPQSLAMPTKFQSFTGSSWQGVRTTLKRIISQWLSTAQPLSKGQMPEKTRMQDRQPLLSSRDPSRTWPEIHADHLPMVPSSAPHSGLQNTTRLYKNQYKIDDNKKMRSTLNAQQTNVAVSIRLQAAYALLLEILPVGFLRSVRAGASALVPPDFDSQLTPEDYAAARRFLEDHAYLPREKRAVQYYQTFFPNHPPAVQQHIALTSDLLTPEVIRGIREIGMSSGAKITVYDFGEAATDGLVRDIRKIKRVRVVETSRGALAGKLNFMLTANEKSGMLSHTVIWASERDYRGVRPDKGHQFVSDPGRFSGKNNLRGANLLLEFLLVQLVARLGQIPEDRLEFDRGREDHRIAFRTDQMIEQFALAHAAIEAILRFA